LHAAIRLDAGRAEPYFALAEHFRMRRRNRLATRYARRGLERHARTPSWGRTLFVEQDMRLGLLRELSIAAYYVGDREAGFAANEALALGADTLRDLATQAVHNEIFYAAPLPGAALARLAPALPDPFVACNPSILRTETGYLINCRAVSYRLDGYQRYRAVEADGVYRTRNFIMEVDRDFGFIRQDELVCELPPLRAHRVQGLEDCRLVPLGDRLAFTSTTTDRHPSGMIQLSLMTLDAHRRVAHHAPLVGYGDNRIQKNWLPFVDETTGALHAVYGYEPLVILRVDPVTGRCAPVVERPHGRPFGDWRGSAGPIALPDACGGGRLLLIHEVAYQGRRYYLHRFVRVDADWRIDRVSRPFYFRHRGIEFAAGACLSHDGADVLITFGVEDREAWLCRIPLHRVLDLLRPLP
jgi:hypothetical protein